MKSGAIITFFQDATIVGITHVVDKAIAFSDVVNCLAFSIFATITYTRVFASIVYASQMLWTVRVKQTFWPAAFVRISEESADAHATCCFVSFLTYRIRSAWIWRTWFDLRCRFLYGY